MPRAGSHAGLGQGVHIQPPRPKVTFGAATPRTIPTGTSPSPCLQTPGTGLWSGCRCRTTTASLPPGPEDLAQEGAGPGLASEPRGSGSTASMNGKRGPSGSGGLTSFSVRSKQLSGCGTPHHGGTPRSSTPPHHGEMEDAQRHGPPRGQHCPVSPAPSPGTASADWRDWKRQEGEEGLEGEPTAGQHCCRAPGDGGVRSGGLGSLPASSPSRLLQAGAAPLLQQPTTFPRGKNSGAFRDSPAASLFPWQNCAHTSSRSHR